MLGAAAGPPRKNTGPTCSLKHSHTTTLVTNAAGPLTAPPYLISRLSGGTTRRAHLPPGCVSVDGHWHTDSPFTGEVPQLAVPPGARKT